jgi:hypothetical protein
MNDAKINFTFLFQVSKRQLSGLRGAVKKDAESIIFKYVENNKVQHGSQPYSCLRHHFPIATFTVAHL